MAECEASELTQFVSSETEAYFPISTSEHQLESMILALSDKILPGWILRKWKKRVYAPGNRGVEADILMISKDCSEWVVVEVELAHHSIKNHIQDQLDRLASAHYGEHLVESLGTFGFTDEQLRNLLRKKPGFLCIADDVNSRLKECCTTTGFALATAKPFYDNQNHPALLFNAPSEFLKPQNLQYVDYPAFKSEIFFGAQSYILPEDFPDFSEIQVKFQGERHVMNVRKLGHSRAFFAPKSIDAENLYDTLLMRAIDIKSGYFEISKESA